MLEIQVLRERKDEVLKKLSKRNGLYTETINNIIDIDAQRRKTQNELDAQLAELNRISKEIGKLMQQGNKAEAEAAKEKTSLLKSSTQELKDKLSSLEHQQQQLLYSIPNTPHELVPQGKSAEDNQEVYKHGAIPVLHKDAVPHWELAHKYNLIDFELGVKISGAGFPVYRNKGAKLQRALINFFLDEATRAGYEETMPPHLVNEASGYGTGQLPDKEGQMYHITQDNLYLIPTAEVPLTNLYRDVVLKEEDFPIKITGYTPCFRREAGSYGKDVRGLNRLHQFDKVEIVQIEHPDKSYQTLDAMVEHVKQLLIKLELPFRIMRLCGGDMGFTSALTYDFEVFSAAQQKWLEVSSTSNFETFQANRLKLRYKDKDGKIKLAHTLNGSALALPRVIAAILENNQTPHGINIPEILHQYTGFKTIE
jgi:seryl-tRNA synthetase